MEHGSYMGIFSCCCSKESHDRSVNDLSFQHPTVSSVTVCRPRKNDDETLGLRGRHRGKRLMLTRCIFLGSTPAPRIPATTRILIHFWFGNPEPNLYLPHGWWVDQIYILYVFTWLAMEGDYSMMTRVYSIYNCSIHNQWDIIDWNIFDWRLWWSW